MALSNEQLFDLIKGGNEDLKPVLWERVKKLAYMLSSQFYRRNTELCRSRGLEECDIKQLSYIAYASLFESYSTDKQYGYTTALDYAVRNEIRQLLGKDSDILNRITDSLDDLIGDGEDGRTLAELIADENSSAPYEEIEDNSAIEALSKSLHEALITLSEQEQTVINGKYFKNMSFKDISHEMNISGERVGQIHRKAIYNLRKPHILRRLRDDRLRDDLGYSSSRIYRGKNSVEYMATERVYLGEIEKLYINKLEEIENAPIC